MSSNTKILTLKDIIIMAVVANFGIRWIPAAATLGSSAIFFWLLSGLLFFLPLVIMAVQLSALHPDEGGLYSWTKKALGSQSGFMVAWLYWVNTLFFYPGILIFLATNFAYFLGKPELTQNQHYITTSVLIAFWSITLLSLLGMRANKYMVMIGGILGSFIPVITIIALGFAAFLHSGHSATAFTAPHLLPQSSVMSSLSTLTMIMFAMAGIEIIPTFANAIQKARKTLFTGLSIAAVILFSLYLLGTVAVNLVLSPDQVQKAAGLMQTFSAIGSTLHLTWFSQTMAFLLTFAEFAAVSIWLLAPIIMFFKCTERGILPDWFHRTNRFNAPQNALLFMGLVVSAIMLMSTYLPTVNDMYEILILMSTVLYFIPYLYLVVAYIKLHHSPYRYLYGTLAFLSTSLGIAFSFQPPDSVVMSHHTTSYLTEMILGPVVFLLLGWWLYRFRGPHNNDTPAPNA